MKIAQAQTEIINLVTKVQILKDKALVFFVTLTREK